MTAAAQGGDPGSTLELYRAALRLRHEHPALGEGTLDWLDASDDVLAFSRGHGFTCVVNLSPRPVALPTPTTVLLASTELPGDGSLPADAAVWLA